MGGGGGYRRKPDGAGIPARHRGGHDRGTPLVRDAVRPSAHPARGAGRSRRSSPGAYRPGLGFVSGGRPGGSTREGRGARRAVPVGGVPLDRRATHRQFRRGARRRTRRRGARWHPVADGRLRRARAGRGRTPRPLGDVHALGAVLAFAATGHTTPERDELPASLRAAVAACLSRDPARRPQAAELVHRFTPTAVASQATVLDTTAALLPAGIIAALARQSASVLAADPPLAPR